jgi:hypothetical protein
MLQLDYSLDKQEENNTYTYYLIKNKNNNSTLSYFKFVPGTDLTKFYNAITLNYNDVTDNYKFYLVQAVIEKEKGTTLSGLSEALNTDCSIALLRKDRLHFIQL